MNDNISYLLCAVVGIAILLLHRFVLSNRPQVWLGALLPAALLAAIVFFGVQGHIDDLRGWVILTSGLLGTLCIWGDGQNARKKRIQREDDRIDAINAQGVDHHRS